MKYDLVPTKNLDSFQPQHNIWGSPEKFGVERFKRAIGKVGGIKIESAAGRQKKNASGDGIS